MEILLGVRKKTFKVAEALGGSSISTFVGCYEEAVQAPVSNDLLMILSRADL